MGSWFGGGKKREEPVIAPPPPPEPVVTDPEKVKRIGRTQLISSSSRGVLGNPETSRKLLSVG